METDDNYRDDKKVFRHEHRHLQNNRALIGVILVLAGAFLILRNMGLLPGFLHNIIFSWQMLLVTIGLVITLGSSGNKTGGVIVMAVGAFFLLPLIFRQTFDFNLFWPAVFIVIGIIFIFSKRKPWQTISRSSQTGDDYIDVINIFSGGERQIISDNFSGGKITSIFGGSEIDLTQSKLAPGLSELEIVCVFGGTSIILPNDWNIKMEVVPVLGGFGDERKLHMGRTVDTSRQLVIKGAVVFGGGELKSY